MPQAPTTVGGMMTASRALTCSAIRSCSVSSPSSASSAMPCATICGASERVIARAQERPDRIAWGEVGLDSERRDVREARAAQQLPGLRADARIRPRRPERGLDPAAHRIDERGFRLRAHGADVVFDHDHGAARAQRLELAAQDVLAIGQVKQQQARDDRVERLARTERPGVRLGGTRCSRRLRPLVSARRSRAAAPPGRPRPPSRRHREGPPPGTPHARGRSQGPARASGHESPPRAAAPPTPPR